MPGVLQAAAPVFDSVEGRQRLVQNAQVLAVLQENAHSLFEHVSGNNAVVDLLRGALGPASAWSAFCLLLDMFVPLA